MMRKLLILVIGLAVPLSLGAQDSIRKRVSRDYMVVVKTIRKAQRTLLPSRSIGYPNKATLENAKELPAKGYGYRMSSAVSRKTNFGTDEMVYGLMILGAEMGDRYGKHGTFYLGDIGRREGGKLSPHVSHQGGRDVDIGLYISDRKGKPQGNKMVKIGKEGGAGGTLQFDLRRNWDFVCLMMDNPFFGKDIRFILIASWIKDLLLAHVKDRILRSRNSRERAYLKKQMDRAEKLLRHQSGHENHYHLRIKCSKDDNKKG